jgi:hypothetical protein
VNAIRGMIEEMADVEHTDRDHQIFEGLFL